MKILLIDDSTDDLYVSKRIIGKHYPAVEVKDFKMGDDALSYLKTTAAGNLPDLIFLDINMPLMDGFQFLAEYEKLPGHITRHCKLYMLTSSENKNDMKKAMENKYVIDYIVKPVQEEVFKNIFG